jgi:hypothetical protein
MLPPNPIKSACQDAVITAPSLSAPVRAVVSKSLLPPQHFWHQLALGALACYEATTSPSYLVPCFPPHSCFHLKTEAPGFLPPAAVPLTTAAFHLSHVPLLSSSLLSRQHDPVSAANICRPTARQWYTTSPSFVRKDSCV